MNQFSERYKTFSNSDLLRVIENQPDYQPEAVEAANNEINQRKLSIQELTEAKSELEAERQEKTIQKEKISKLEGKVNTLGTSFFNSINPIQKSIPTAERQIRLISIVFGLIALITWYSQFRLAQSLLTINLSEWDASMIEFFLPLIILPITVVTFWRRKKIGWVLMAAFLTYTVIGAFIFIILTWNMRPTGVTPFDNLLPQISWTSQIWSTLFFGGTLWVLTKQEIKEHFSINRQTTIATIAIVGILTILFFAPLLLR